MAELLVHVFEAVSIVFVVACFAWTLRKWQDYRWWNIAFAFIMAFYVIFHYTIHALGLTGGTHQIATGLFDFLHYMLDDVIVMLAAWLNAHATRDDKITLRLDRRYNTKDRRKR